MAIPQNKPVLIIGGGISGITTAVEIAEVGKEVVLIEQKPYLGGNVIKMNNYFPKLCPPACGLEINFRRIRQNSRIKYYTSITLLEILGAKSKCCKNSNLDCNFGLCNCAYYKKETKAYTINLRNSTDLKYKHI